GVVFSGLSVSGYSDLYRLWLADPGDSAGAGRLERLTSDRYEDVDPTISPDGRTVVFSSDRTPFGRGGAHNLFALDLPTGTIRYLTYGDWRDESPRWGGGRRPHLLHLRPRRHIPGVLDRCNGHGAARDEAVER